MKYPELPENIAHYKILSILGRGGMGIVYLAEDSRLRRQVAIKCLYKQQQSEALVERLRREAKVLAKLNHPNVVHIYDVVDDEQGFALVMEYVKGRSLKHYLKENNLSQRQQLALLVQILEGLSAAHSQGIIHRDLKLDNILIDEHGRAKIGDFGIAKRQSGDTVELTKHNNISGSLSAMSPEQIRGETLTTASDTFSFGLLAWQILRSQHPFEADSELLRVEKILNETAPSLASDYLPQGFSDCLDETLNKEADKRPQDIPVLIQSLKSYALELNDEIDDPTLTLRPKFFQTSSSNQAWVYTATILLTLLLVLLAAREAYMWLQPEPDSIYVAVLPPELEAKDNLDYGDIQKTVYFALQEGVIALQSSFLIPAGEVEGFEGGSELLAKAIGADVVIESELACESLVCDLQLKSVIGDEISEVSVEVDGRLLETHQLSQHRLAELFSNREGLQTLSDVISEADYKEYFRLNILAKESESHKEDVINSLEIIQKRSPKFEPVYYLHTQLALDLFEEGREESFANRAEELLKQAHDELPDSPLVIGLLAELYAETGRIDLAKGKIDELSKMGGDVREVEVLLGLHAESLRDYNQAIVYFKRANSIRPSVRTYRDVAINYWYLGDVDNAISNLKEARTLNPNDIHAGITLASFLLPAGQLDAAEKLFLKFVDSSPISSTYTNIGLLYMLKREYKKSEVNLRKAVELAPKNVNAMLNLADIYLLMSDGEKAFPIYRKIVEETESKKDISSLVAKSQALMHLEKYREALKTFNEIKEISTQSTALYAEAMMFSKLNDYPSAIVALERSLENGFGKIWYTLPWFDGLCSDPMYGPEFKNLTGYSCSEN